MKYVRLISIWAVLIATGCTSWITTGQTAYSPLFEGPLSKQKRISVRPPMSPDGQPCPMADAIHAQLLKTLEGGGLFPTGRAFPEIVPLTPTGRVARGVTASVGFVGECRLALYRAQLPRISMTGVIEVRDRRGVRLDSQPWTMAAGEVPPRSDPSVIHISASAAFGTHSWAEVSKLFSGHPQTVYRRQGKFAMRKAPKEIRLLDGRWSLGDYNAFAQRYDWAVDHQAPRIGQNLAVALWGRQIMISETCRANIFNPGQLRRRQQLAMTFNVRRSAHDTARRCEAMATLTPVEIHWPSPFDGPPRSGMPLPSAGY